MPITFKRKINRHAILCLNYQVSIDEEYVCIHLHTMTYSEAKNKLMQMLIDLIEITKRQKVELMRYKSDESISHNSSLRRIESVFAKHTFGSEPDSEIIFRFINHQLLQ